MKFPSSFVAVGPVPGSGANSHALLAYRRGLGDPESAATDSRVPSLPASYAGPAVIAFFEQQMARDARRRGRPPATVRRNWRTRCAKRAASCLPFPAALGRAAALTPDSGT